MDHNATQALKTNESPLRVTSVEEFLGQIDQAFKKICPPAEQARCAMWFRGQPVVTFNLIPAIARPPFNTNLEVVLLSKFKSLVTPYVGVLPSFPLPDGFPSYWHWLFMMQHYGVKTRLLDWSRDALTALYFAVHQSESEKGNDAAVWCLNPVKLNEAFSFHSFLKPGYIPNVDEHVVDLYFGPNAQILHTKKPAAVIGPLNSPRIVAQRGVFTVFPHEQELIPLNLFPDSSAFLFKIPVAKESLSHIIQQLQHYGITRIALFPEIQSISDEIALELQAEGF